MGSSSRLLCIRMRPTEDERTTSRSTKRYKNKSPHLRNRLQTHAALRGEADLQTVVFPPEFDPKRSYSLPSLPQVTSVNRRMPLKCAPIILFIERNAR